MSDATLSAAAPVGVVPPVEAADGSAAVAPAQSVAAGSPADSQEGGRALGAGDFALIALISLIVSVLVGFGGWLLLGQKSQSFAVVDLPEIIEIEQLSFTVAAMKPDLTDSQRAAAYEEVKAFGPRLEQAIEQVKKKCGCVLLMRSAYVGRVDKDLTLEIKTALGMQNLDVKAMKEQVTRSVQGLPDQVKK
ncbi:hypothetical protein [Ottowia sp.]|uniref:hypothetical protein n=1 Tax=Ottowia sp. TaxID=1898956 RepID=UPI0025F9BCAB|nr:hypothetical protein [Ottowia sp.]MBK6616134.1 hypothetical protein [Ottowia sp.]